MNTSFVQTIPHVIPPDCTIISTPEYGSQQERFLSIRLDSVKKEITKEGFYKFYDVPVARSGPFDYIADELIHDGALDQGYKRGKTLIGYRPKSTFTQEVIDSIKGMPLTLHHPESGMATPDNVENHGSIGRPYLKEMEDGETGLFIDEIFLHSKEIISAYNRGLKELSIGFFYKKPVEWVKDENYNFIEEITKINHLALVRKGRAGHGFRLHNKLEVYEKMDEKLEKLFDKLSENLIASTAASETTAILINEMTTKLGDLVRSNEEKAKEEAKEKEEKAKTDAADDVEEGKKAKPAKEEEEKDTREHDVFMNPTDFKSIIMKALPDNTIYGYSIGGKAFTGNSAPKIKKLFQDEADVRKLSMRMNEMTVTTDEGTRTHSAIKKPMIAVGD
jgi:hypothetical protein